MANGPITTIVLALAALQAVAADGPSGSGQSAPPVDDVVVTARRMRLVSLAYTMNGPYLDRCEIDRSSGDARIDRTMCVVLDRCIRSGSRDPVPAKRCLDASIESFASGARRPPDPDALRLPPPALPVPASATPAPSLAPARTEDVVVRGILPHLDAGRWRFVEQKGLPSGRSLMREWRQCIRPGGIEEMLRVMLQVGEQRSAESRCGAMTLKIRGGRVDGERACLSSRSRYKTRLTGSFDQGRIVTDATTYLVFSADGRSRGDAGVLPDDDGFSRFTGERVGECRADEAPGADRP